MRSSGAYKHGCGGPAVTLTNKTAKNNLLY